MSYQSHEQERVHDEPFTTPTAQPGVNGSAEHEPDNLDVLIDELEALVVESRRMPLSPMLLINQETLLDLVDRLRAAVPSEVRHAQRVLSQQQQIVEHAQTQAVRLLQERGLMQRLETERKQIIAQAQREADATRDEADRYARDVLIQLQKRLQNVQASVQQGIDTLDA
jgi:cell division septum initiation protein DivIVA